jgi:LysM repeat protein
MRHSSHASATAVGRITSTVQFAAANQPRSGISRLLAPAALAVLLGAIIVVVVTSAGPSSTHSLSTTSTTATIHGLAPYWTVHPGDTYARISEKTGLSIAQLEAFNPDTDPNNLLPGQRLNLWLHPPPPRPKPLGPRFWTVRPGESLGSIAAQTAIGLTKLEQLNPRLNPATLQPGDRVRLRP